MGQRRIATTTRLWPALRLIGLCAVLAVAPGCPTLAANSARNSYINAQAAKFEYDEAPNKLALEAQRLVRARGYKLAPGSDALAFDTEWSDMPGGRQRLNVQLTSHKASSGTDKVRAHFTRIEERVNLPRRALRCP